MIPFFDRLLDNLVIICTGMIFGRSVSVGDWYLTALSVTVAGAQTWLMIRVRRREWEDL